MDKLTELKSRLEIWRNKLKSHKRAPKTIAFWFDSTSLVAQTVNNVGDPASIPGMGRSPGEGNGNPLQYSCLENPMDGGA